jgi:AP-1 complex subunit gamma-1
MVVFDQDSLRITFDIARTPGVAGGATITATATNAGLEDVADFSLQAAVPKFLSLRLEPASGSSIPSLGGTVRQTLHVVNGSGGAKPLIMRVRLGYSRDGGPPQSHQLEVANFPPGF